MAEIREGKFIVIEGTDGSGKTEQFNRLLLALPTTVKIRSIDFPRYSEPAAHCVSQYLNGHYGPNVDAYQASLFYALDRFDAKPKILQWFEEGQTIIANRYTGSNMGHQGAKIKDKQERIKFFKWLYEFEYGLLGIPRPNLSIVLHVPAEIAQALISKKGAREYLGGKSKDIHEEDLEHQKRAEEVYLEIAGLYPKDFVVVECAPGGKMLSIDEVHQKVWAIVKKTLNI